MKIVIMTTIWSIWLQKNRSIFEDEETIEVSWKIINVRTGLWLDTRVENFQMFLYSDLVRDWFSIL